MGTKPAETFLLILLSAVALVVTDARADDAASERLSFDGVVAFAGVLGSDGGGALFQPEAAFRLDDSSEVFVKLGFALGDGPGGTDAFALSPWAADLAEDVEDINGRKRDHVLNAWYRYTAALGAGRSLAATIGIIDAADFLDANAYSNDEFTQFMNSALVNSTTLFMPSYDRGIALDWIGRRWSARGVYMHVAENDDGNDYGFFGFELSRRQDLSFGEGNYRLVFGRTDDRFLDPSGTRSEGRAGFGLSLDQQVGEALGVFLRVGRETDRAAIDCRASYSAGLDLDGGPWRRPDDNVGVGLAHVSGGNRDLKRSSVVEAYYRAGLTGAVAVTADVQYIAENSHGAQRLDGLLVGLRVTVVL